MEVGKGKWKKEMEKRTLTTLLNKENDDENPTTKKVKAPTTDPHSLLNSIKTFSNPLTTVVLNNQSNASPSNTKLPQTSTIKSAFSQQTPSAPNLVQSKALFQQIDSKATITTNYDYTNESDSLIQVLKLIGQIKNPNEFSVCGEASEMPGHAGLYIKGYGYITPPLPIYQAEELIHRMRPYGTNVDLKRVGGPSIFTIKDIYELDSCEIEIKNPKVKLDNYIDNVGLSDCKVKQSFRTLSNSNDNLYYLFYSATIFFLVLVISKCCTFIP